jgi:hypothetical protein
VQSPWDASQYGHTTGRPRLVLYVVLEPLHSGSVRDGIPHESSKAAGAPTVKDAPAAVVWSGSDGGCVGNAVVVWW